MKKIKFILSAILLLAIQQVATAQWVGVTGGINYPSGNVGIGTTTPTSDLHIVKGGTSSLQLESTDGRSLFIANYHNDNGGICITRQGVYKAAVFYKDNGGLQFYETNGVNMVLKDGKLGLGTLTPQYKIDVNGTVRGQELICDAPSAWPDYVFSPTYRLRSLSELSDYIQANGHLPNIPSAKEVEADGIKIAEMNKNLLEKVEELTLYTIDQESKLEKQEKMIQTLLERLEKLENK